MRLFVASLILCLALASARNLPADHHARKLIGLQEPQAPVGWWQSGVALLPRGNGTYCGLRDFPGLPDGYGTSRMLCGGYTTKFDPLWKWKIQKVNPVVGAQTDVIVSGEAVYLRIFNTVLTYCGLNGRQNINCGVPINRAALFTIEKAGGAPGSIINFATDLVHLKSGALYCTVQGSTNSAFVTCNQAAPGVAGFFKFPFAHYYGASVISSAGIPCGANFIPFNALELPWVNCTLPTIAPKNFYTKVSLTMYNPGAPVLMDRTAYSLNAYDTLYHYQGATWTMQATWPYRVYSQENDSSKDTQWFVLERVDQVLPGYPLVSGNIVLIKNTKNNMYCGIDGTAQIKCDLLTVPPGLAAYYFSIIIE
mmetsp:Transcript_24477/g.53474  ORF Transcript_24477/g.53474 Transcript_24477/m.53474 type:complete len:366 (+) Transcript_24477:77-1174(+)|eukprot:CAMPEP_0202899832 /NCGR_PEP_ID=MMETSP1392-20130828/8783_1 /ASSEMBLY_ACC=CAM_ASM_000868 /TAXON_ID=225041 /ORGANISM="Chlamydomonas chlamydogama, Strain SAG 11-48b" /LENGTH=365 /DNA_ID=CAMNT_0049586107 /DNA_START=78 /DNA_END=1175 /DNA_ORIENTATION=+